MKVKDLKAAEYNPRTITDKKLDMLGKSMQEFGDLSGIVFNVKTKRLIGGHQRIKHLKPDWKIIKNPLKDKHGTVSEGYIETPYGRWLYREVNWPEKKEMMANIAANKHGGEFDIPKLKDVIVKVDDGSQDMELSGFSEKEIEELSEFEPSMEGQLEEKKEELKPYKKMHILLSFSPDKLLKIQPYLEKIIKIEGIEYEQSAN